jgi:hypothetical protein
VSLSVPAGSYVITATGDVEAAQTTGGTVICQLHAATGVDAIVITLFPKNWSEITLDLAETFDQPGIVTLVCATLDSQAPMSLFDAKIIATRVGKITGQSA